MSVRENSITDLYHDVVQLGLHRAELMAQVLVLLLSLFLAWLISRFFLNRARSKQEPSLSRSRQESTVKLVSILLACVLVLVGYDTLEDLYPNIKLKFLDVALLLLLAMATIRVVATMLNHLFPDAAWLKRWRPLLSLLVWGLYALHVTGLLKRIERFLDQINIDDVGRQHISLLTVSRGLLLVSLVVLVALWIGRLFERRLDTTHGVDANVKIVLSKLVRAGLIIVSVLISLPMVGIDLTVLSVLGGALGVGLGFGLQKIASNYVSGFIILLDRSIKLGDLVQIENRTGIVAKLTSRYVLLKGMDGTDALIPNETFIISTVINQSYSDRKVLITLPIQVAYGTDVEEVLALLMELACSEPRVSQSPAPKAFLRGFGESALDLELGVWVDDPENGTLSIRSNLNLKILQAFAELGIEIPYPQRQIEVINKTKTASY